MKKKNTIVAITFIFITVIVSGYYVYNNLCPVAKPIQHPPIEDIISINISTDDNRESKISGIDFVRIATYISNSKPTRIMSVNDSPIIRPYYKIAVLTEIKTFNYYVYKNNNKVYIESPYEGVYIIDSQVVNILSISSGT